MKPKEFKMSVDPSNILVTGITSIRPFAMEYENLGNFVIIEPFFRTLRDEFPDSTIVTTLQLTDKYCQRAGISVLRDRLLWSYGYKNMLRSFLDLLLAFIWAFLNRLLKADIKCLFTLSPRLRAISNADLVLDFGGDMFGDNAHSRCHFWIGCMMTLMAKLLGKKTFFVASSPGPFKSVYQQSIARFVLRRYDLVAIREPLSLYNINFIGLVGPKFVWYPCPSVGFRPAIAMTIDEILAREPRLAAEDKPLVGLILCNLNMSELPLYKWPREDREYTEFIRLVEYLVKTLNVRVCIMSHQNKTDAQGNFVPGPDHRLVGRLIQLIPDDIDGEVFTLRGLYDTSSINRIISRFEMLVSGRIHGAMQGLSQCIPTAIIDYGMGPKAHKLKGFALMTGMYDYICDPVSADNMIAVVDRLWRDHELVRKRLCERVPELERQSRQLWKRVRQIVEKK